MTDENRASSEETVMEADMEYDPEDPMNHSRYELNIAAEKNNIIIYEFIWKL